MNNGWIKLHRQLLDNDFLQRDITCYVVFTKLLLFVNDRGECTIGRYQLQKLTGVNGSTAYRAVKRLENAKMLTTSVTARFTRINILNWNKFQDNAHRLTHSSRTGDAQVTHTKQEIRIKNKNIYKSSFDETATAITVLYKLYLGEFGTTESRFKLTPARKSKLRARINDAGSELITKAIKNTAASAFHRGENDRNWKANLDFIIRSYEQVERLAEMPVTDKPEDFDIKKIDWGKLK